MPDIDGAIQYVMAETPVDTGAFMYGTVLNTGITMITNGSSKGRVATFLASRSNSQYGASDTVMPASADILVAVYLGRTPKV